MTDKELILLRIMMSLLHMQPKGCAFSSSLLFCYFSEGGEWFPYSMRPLYAFQYVSTLILHFLLSFFVIATAWIEFCMEKGVLTVLSWLCKTPMPHHAYPLLPRVCFCHLNVGNYTLFICYLFKRHHTEIVYFSFYAAGFFLSNLFPWSMYSLNY